jgi:hypothetical protein
MKDFAVQGINFPIHIMNSNISSGCKELLLQ